jgi:hypothetical protein
MKTISGKLSKLPSLNGVLDKWIKANGSLVKSWRADGDVPWWYNERASLSILAGAAWMDGAIAFEEFVADKRKSGVRRRKSQPYRGRTDIYLKVGNHEFIGEAKQCWSGATAKSSNPVKSIQKWLNAACSDVRGTKPFGQRRVGILFAMPYFKKSAKDKIDDHIERWVDKIMSVDCSCCAWVFPVEARYAQYGRYDENLHPGIALFIREV